MFDPIKNAGAEAWKNPAFLECTTAFEHKSAEIVTKELLNSNTKQPSAGESAEEPVRDERTRDETTARTDVKPTWEVSGIQEPRSEVLTQAVPKKAKEDGMIYFYLK